MNNIEAAYNKQLADLVELEAPSLEEAYTVLGALWEEYFASASDDGKAKDCRLIAGDYEYISATLHMASDVLFRFCRDVDAAQGIESLPVRAYMRNKAPLYSGFEIQKEAAK